MHTDTNTITKAILETVSGSAERITPIELEKRISKKYFLEKKRVKSVIQDLITNGELIYTYQYGSTFLEQSFNRPVRISKHVVIKPLEKSFNANPNDVVINLNQGASFGTGQHPTTRLSIRGIEYVAKECDHFKRNQKSGVLDVGTGSGILVIAAVLLGAHSGMGVDTDPCSIAEAKENIKINGLQHKINISDRSLEKIDQVFSMITANLRHPTLIRLLPFLSKALHKKGFMVFSGIKTGEMKRLLHIYQEKDFICRWKEVEQDWAGVVFEKAG
jgi:ribosomal protein L11 methyltransferase